MRIELDQLSRTFGALRALDAATFEVKNGELLALLGPSGSGKTTLLRMLAGLELPDQGRVLYDGRDVTREPVGRRNVGFVFQNYALFPHLTVFENIAFALRVRGEATKDIRPRVEELLALVRLESFAERHPRQLSGGQRQRVALARALAPRPQALLLDEPFGALDAQVRQELREWLRRLHDTLDVTTVFVTHDQAEAFEVADRVVLLNQGRVEQIGTPEEVQAKPASEFVLGFLGGVNILNGVAQGGIARVGAMVFPFECPPGPEQAVRAYLRYGDVELVPRGSAGSSEGTVQRIQRHGVVSRVTIDVRGVLVRADVEARVAESAPAGSSVAFRAREARVFAGPEGNRISRLP